MPPKPGERKTAAWSWLPGNSMESTPAHYRIFRQISGMGIGQARPLPMYRRCGVTGKKAEAISACQEFLGHFEKPPSKLPQIAEARAALKRLGAQ
jgi:hypothetical protein